MNQIKRFAHSKAFPYIVAFGLPFLICVIICIGNGVYPFGDNCILHIDMYHQYCPFFTEFLNKLQTGGSLQYSWNLGLGSDFVSLYAYYLASPLNFLILLCPKSHVIEFMTLLIILKISASGLTFFLYIRHHYKLIGKDGRMHKNQMIPALVFSTAYALSGFVAAYSWDIMWMDCIALFPLIMIGLERLVQEKKAGLYYITLALCIFCNYYISIMICIFLVFAFALLFFSQKKGKGGAILRFGWYSLLAGASSAILLLPEIAVLSVSGSAEGGFPKTAEFYFNILAELGRGAAVTSVYTGNDHWPNLYAGAFSLFLVWIYVLNRRISWKEKAPRIAMLVFFLVSFAENQLDYIWHGMHFPQALPGRQSFLYSFVLLSMGFAAVRKRKGTRIWNIAVAAIVSMALLLVAGWYGDETVTEPVSLVITALFICVYAVAFVLTKITGKKKRLAFAQFAVFVAVAELAINMAATGFGTTSRVAYTEKQSDYEKILEMAKEDNEETGSGFYRVEDTGRKTKNDDSLYGYASATIFSSLMNLDVSHLFQSLFMEGGKNFYCYNGATPLSSSLFSVKYMLSDNALEKSPYRTLVGGSGKSFLYRNNFSLPLGFVMDEQAIADWNVSSADRMASLNSFASALGAEGQMLYPATYVTDANAGDTTIDIAEDGYYYADYESCTSDTLTVNRSDGWTKQYSKTSHRYLIELGECKAGDEIHILNSNMESIEFEVYQLNEKVVQQAFDALNAQTMQLTDMTTDRKIEGKIQVQNAGRLVLSVPADEGWTLYVDGKETEIEPLADALVGVHLEKGSHTIKLCYTTPGVKAGAGFSLGAVVLFMISAYVSTRIRRKRELHE